LEEYRALKSEIEALEIETASNPKIGTKSS